MVAELQFANDFGIALGAHQRADMHAAESSRRRNYKTADWRCLFRLRQSVGVFKIGQDPLRSLKIATAGVCQTYRSRCALKQADAEVLREPPPIG
jgi:hypothetical protein